MVLLMTGSLLGIVVGYALAVLHVRIANRAADWLDRDLEREAGRNHRTWQERRSTAYVGPLHTHPDLLRTRFAPEGFTAKDILPTSDAHGSPCKPLYPGGIDAWYANHGFNFRKEDCGDD